MGERKLILIQAKVFVNGSVPEMERKGTAMGRVVPSDVDLLHSFVDQRDRAAITDIVDRHGLMVMGVCRNILRNEHDAADAFQATFLVLLKKARSIGKSASLANWLHGVACRVAKRARSRSGPQPMYEDPGAEMMSTDPSVKVASEEEVGLIHEELDRMPERYRLPVILCCLEGETQEQVSRRLGWTAGTVKGRLERGRVMLRVRLKKRGLVIPAAMLTAILAQQAVAQVPGALVGTTVDAAMLVASGQLMAGGAISVNALLLSQEVMKAMLVTKLKIAAMILLAGSVVAGGSAVVFRHVFAAAPPDAVAADTAGLSTDDKGGVADDDSREAAGTSQKATADAKQPTASKDSREKDNASLQWNGLTDEQKDEISLRQLKALWYAMHDYADKHDGKLPPAAVPNPNLPLTQRLSGFVLLLPHLGVRPSIVPEDDEMWKKWHADNDAARKLFDTIDLKQAWDDPVNAKAAKTIVQEFVVPSGAPLRNEGGYAVSHFAFVRGSDGTDNGTFPLDGVAGLTIGDIPDGTSFTLAIGQIHENLGPWIAAGSSTARFACHPSEPGQKSSFGSQYPGCAYFVNGDGFAYFFDMANTEKQILYFLAGRDDGPAGAIKADDYLRYASASEWKQSKEKK